MKPTFKLLLSIIALSCIMSASARVVPGTADEKLTTIELWYGKAVKDAPPPPEDWKAYSIIREKLGINLVLKDLPYAQEEQDRYISIAAASNTLPDIFLIGRDLWLDLVPTGLLAPVDSLYPKMPKRTAQQYDRDSIAYTTIKGKSYGLASPGSIVKNEGLVIRKDWLDTLGLPVPRTLDDLLKTAKAFTEQDPDRNGKNDTYGFGAFFENNNYERALGRRFDPIAGAFGVEGAWNLDSKEPGLTIRKPPFYDFLDTVKRLIDSGWIDPNWIVYKKDDFRTAWKQGRFGIFREQNAALHNETNYTTFEANCPRGELIVIDPPLGPDGKSSVGVYEQAYRLYGVSAHSIRSGKEEAIAKLLEWMSSDEGYFLLGWGEEGVNYTRDRNGTPSVVGLRTPEQAYSKPSTQPLTQLRTLVYYNGDIELQSRYPTYISSYSGKTISALKTLRDMQGRPWTPLIGANTIPGPDKELEYFMQQSMLEFLHFNTRPLTREGWSAWLAEFDAKGGLQWEQKGIAWAKEKFLLR